ncbi:MAG: hypothetical protein IPJ98_14870 [Bryobacterales bacterium]|nr:hypothetical protein [Bryobacterales bacterium]
MAQTSGAGTYRPSIRDEAVTQATGRGWSAWFALLDGAGAQSWTHAAMAHWLTGEHGVAAWWSQSITVEYERARGLRAVHEKAGGFAASASKTVAVSVDDLSRWWTEAGLRRKWLAAPGITIRKSTPGKSVRITWSDGSRVNAFFFAKGEKKSQVSVDHEKLPDAAAVAKAKAEWKLALARLAALATAAAKPVQV